MPQLPSTHMRCPRPWACGKKMETGWKRPVSRHTGILYGWICLKACLNSLLCNLKKMFYQGSLIILFYPILKCLFSRSLSFVKGPVPRGCLSFLSRLFFDVDAFRGCCQKDPPLDGSPAKRAPLLTAPTFYFSPGSDAGWAGRKSLLCKQP